MKNQYVADAGDYGKLGLLRFLEGKGISIALNWYLTDNDGSNDGKHIGYLDKPPERKKDPELFDYLKMLIRYGKRDVTFLESGRLLNNAVYYHEILDVSDCGTVMERQSKRNAWHKKALSVCAGKELVFLDPDNGIKKNTTKGLSEAVKYAFTTEAADYYKRGQNVVYYCSKARRTDSVWEEYKRIMQESIPMARLLAVTFHGGTQRSYVFVLHEKDYERYLRIINEFLKTEWRSGNNRFTFEIV